MQATRIADSNAPRKNFEGDPITLAPVLNMTVLSTLAKLWKAASRASSTTTVSRTLAISSSPLCSGVDWYTLSVSDSPNGAPYALDSVQLILRTGAVSLKLIRLPILDGSWRALRLRNQDQPPGRPMSGWLRRELHGRVICHGNTSTPEPSTAVDMRSSLSLIVESRTENLF